MEKLINLLSEYDEYRGEKRRDYGWTKDKVELDVKTIIFKKFGFIKWLVENEKINEEEYQFMGTDDMKYNYSDYECLLMLLSIQDEPINFLISILK